jgi:hypothetical protein
MDSFEFLTRAVTRQRIIVDNTLNGSPASPFGNFSFCVYYADQAVSLRLKQGILPDDFAALGKKCESGFGDEAEQERWNGLKHGLGEVIMQKDPSELFESEIHPAAAGR